MHNCPSCGSCQIQLLIERTGGNISFGGAMAGAAIGEMLLGDAGGIVGGIVGAKAFSQPIQETQTNYCMNCGNRWNARELFELISLVSDLLDAEIDLSIELHRYCLADFVETIIPKISHWQKAQRNRPCMVSAASNKIPSRPMNLIELVFITVVTIAFFCLLLNQILAIFLIALSIPLFLSMKHTAKRELLELKKIREIKEREALAIANRNIDAARKELDDAISLFVSKYTAYCLPV